MKKQSMVVRGSAKQQEARKKLHKLFQASPLPTEQQLTNLGLYLRSSCLAKILYLNELYQKILPLPGIIMEFGCWWGQNLALFESLRAIYEPYNFSRMVVGFDTFRGYSAPHSQDGTSEHIQKGAYSVSSHYEEYLVQLLDYHERENPLSHIKKYTLVKGNVSVTLPRYLHDNPHTLIALAYFDMQLYEPTRQSLEAIYPYLFPGSVLAMDELNCQDFPGETLAFREVFREKEYHIQRSQFLPDRSVVVLGKRS